MEKKLLTQIPSIGSSQVLTDEMMSQIENGACSIACKKSCITSMNTATPDKEEDPAPIIKPETTTNPGGAGGGSTSATSEKKDGTVVR